jgi:hypothetical protein
VDGGGQIRHYAPVRESAHRVIKRAADSPLVQAIPVVGDIADGYVAADYAAKGDYKPAAAAIAGGLILPDIVEVARRIPASAKIKKFSDYMKYMTDNEKEAMLKQIGNSSVIKPEMSEDVVKILNDIKSGKRKLTKDIHGRMPYGNTKTPPSDLDMDKIWIPERIYDDVDDVVDYGTREVSNEPW